ncbi:MAG: FAD-dependent oxidoreductase [Hyphomicrobiales bacterium]
MHSVVVIGAGPAGISAAGALIDHGVHPVVIDEAPRPGGQAYRSAAPNVELDMARLLGSEFAKYRRIHASAERLRERADYRPLTTAWGLHEGELYTHGPSGTASIRFDALILATGATDRIFPAAGWTRPGVFTLGAAQVLLKDQGHLIGRKVVFCGSSPLLYLAALQYHLAGAEVVAVLDTTCFSDKVMAVPKLASNPTTLWRGLSYMRALRGAGIRLEHGAELIELKAANGEDDEQSGVGAVSFRDRNAKAETLECDAVALGFGLRPEAQLAALAECAFHYDSTYRQWFATTDRDGRGRDNVYLAGDGAAIGGADAAEVSGRLAAFAALTDLELAAPSHEMARLRRRLARLRRFQAGLARAFSWPGAGAGAVNDTTVVCRCENVTAGDIRRTVTSEFGPPEINRIKALTRCGMGRCQGRFCEPAAAEIAASRLRQPLQNIGRLRGQAPVKPLPVSAAFEVKQPS